MPAVIDLTNSDSGSSDQDDETRSSTVSSEPPNDGRPNSSIPKPLAKAVSSVSGKRLREIVLDLAAQVPAAKQFLERELLVANGAKRPSTVRWETCEKCAEEFDIGEEREDGECVYHPGEMMPDYEEGFVDWDEACHGPIDTEENRRQYPENFIWTCCDELGIASGCVRDEHAPARASRKRARH